MRTALWKATLVVALKELRTGSRDRQTVVYAVVLPLCLYPLVLWCLVQGSLFIQGRAERTEVQVGLASSQPASLPPELVDALRTSPADPLAPAQGGPGIEPLMIASAHTSMTPAEARAWSRGEAHMRAPHAVLWIPGPEDSEAHAQLFFDATSSRSQLASERITTRLEAFARDRRRADLDALGIEPGVLLPFEVETRNVAAPADVLSTTLALVLPMLLVMMCVMGAFFPAVDLTAGEKERNTAETTLLLPVPRLAVHQGKILAVCVSAMLATGLNLLALALSVGHLLEMIGDGAGVTLTEFPFLSLLAISPLAVLFAFFVSAVLTGVSSLTNNFKEGQALLGPVQMAFLLPAMAGLVPGMHLTLPLACVPVVNVVLAFRSLLQGELLPAEYAVTALSLLFFGLLATRLAVLLLSRESAQFERVSIRKLSTLLHSPSHAE